MPAAIFMGSTAASAAPIVSDFDPAIISDNPMGNPAQSNAAQGTIRTDASLGALATGTRLSARR